MNMKLGEVSIREVRSFFYAGKLWRKRSPVLTVVEFLDIIVILQSLDVLMLFPT
jgi:hypothetical protein